MKKGNAFFHELVGAYSYMYLFFVLTGFCLLTQDGNEGIMELCRLHTLIWIPGYLYWLRSKILEGKRRGLYIALHFIIFCMAAVYQPTQRPQAFLILMCLLIFCLVFSIILINMKEEVHASSGVLAAYGTVLIIMYLCTEEKLIQGYLFIAAASLTILYLSDLHFFNVGRTVENSAQMLQQSVSRTKRYNHNIFFGALMIIVALIMLLLGLGLDRVLDRMFGTVMRAVVRMIRGIGQSSESEEVIDLGILTGDDSMENPIIDETESGFFLQQNGTVFWILGIIFLGVVIIGVVSALRHRREAASRVDMTYYEEKQTYRGKRERIKRFRDGARYGSREQRIRSLYYRTVEQQIKSGMVIKQSDTSGEIQERVECLDFDRITDLYEKARYSANKITEEDVKEMQCNVERIRRSK